jgi:hypothetical protein
MCRWLARNFTSQHRSSLFLEISYSYLFFFFKSYKHSTRSIARDFRCLTLDIDQLKNQLTQESRLLEAELHVARYLLRLYMHDDFLEYVTGGIIKQYGEKALMVRRRENHIPWTYT